MTGTLKALSILLSYPTEAVAAAAPDLKQMIERDGLVPAKHRRGLNALIDEIATRDLFDLQERYVFLFDRTRTLSLHIFEHIHGESRDRGQAMVDLMQMYERNGLYIEARELPDYLPLFLEFLSTLPLAEALGLLAEPLHILTALRERHRKRKSAYTPVFAALAALPGAKAKTQDVDDLLSEPEDDPNDLNALDRVWEEAAVNFGPGAPAAPGAADGACPTIRDTLARMDRPRNPTAS